MEPRVAYGGDIDGGAALEGVADHGVAAVVLGDARVQGADLRTDAGGGEVAHAQRVVRRAELDAVEDLG